MFKTSFFPLGVFPHRRESSRLSDLTKSAAKCGKTAHFSRQPIKPDRRLGTLDAHLNRYFLT